MICDYEELEFFDPKTSRKAKIYRPIVGVNLIKRGFKLFPIDCLIDSGADPIIFPIDLAHYFRVDCKKGYETEFRVADGGSVKFLEVSYEKHQIDIFINDVRVKEKIYFSKGQKMPLLGQDFFKYFKIIFQRARKKFSLEAI
ncbi:MAG: hypothetical protein AAB953_03720 [Patescibacteria group bacterium]